MRGSILIVIFLITSLTYAQPRTWVEDELLIEHQLNNPLALSEDNFKKSLDFGIGYSLLYPVDTGIHFPYQPFFDIYSKKTFNPIRVVAKKYIKNLTKSDSLFELQDRLGLTDFPKYSTELDPLPYYIPGNIPFNSDIQKMGFTLKEINNARAFTISCAQCHTSNLFGKAVIGLSTRFPRPNDFFVQVKDVFKKYSVNTFKLIADFKDDEFAMLKKAKLQLDYIGAKIPVQLGLDTSLAQVSLSLAKRNKDAIASFPDSPYSTKSHPLHTFIADSKPMVWWNVKYKNKWLADGSVVSGNPILTNILWNEVGRGADLEELESWTDKYKAIIDHLTTAVFASEAPKMADFVDINYFAELDRLQEGQKIYAQMCSKCHGTYEKAWDTNPDLPLYDLIQTTNIIYSENTKSNDVGTSSNRYQAMQHLLPLNDLQFSKKNNIVIKPQKGYVPPPLVGVWARYPYFHNNSIPSLCDLLSPGNQRPKQYMATLPENIDTDFDLSCNGYPQVKLNKKSELYFDSTKPGLNNKGHDNKILLDEDGNEILSQSEKINLIYFLQTL